MISQLKNFFVLTAFSIIFLTSCSPAYTYFTTDLYQQEQWSEEDLRQIQFYTSKEIVLTRQISAGETAIAGGKIIVKNGQRYEKVVIPMNTPGVLVLMPREDRMAISFEDKDNDAFLMFGPNPEIDNRFALLAQDWEMEQGQVHYKDKVYVVDAQYAYSCLMVDLRKEGQNQYETKSVKGRTLE
jgi:hypothetical protein